MRFIISDESINSYGFWLLTSGGDLSQFVKNPIMLWMHNRAFRGMKDEVLPIGSWQDVKVEGNTITAEANFDMTDPFAASIASKVEQGIIKMASAGIEIIATSQEPQYVKPGQYRETVTKWRLKEGSIVDIGSNDNALTLYDKKGNILNLFTPEGEIDADKLSVKLIDSTQEDPNKDTKTTLKMKKIALLFGMAEAATEEELAAKVTATLADKDGEIVRLTNEVKVLKDAEKTKVKADAVALVDAAVKDGRIDATGKDSFLKLFDTDPESAKVTLSSIPKRKTAEELLKEGNKGAEGEREKLAKLSWDELDKTGKLSYVKEKHRELFDEKFEGKFGTKPVQ